MKYLILIPDGMADRKHPALGGHTPMEKADKPEMNSLVRRSLTGVVSNVPAGMVPESDTANLAIQFINFDIFYCFHAISTFFV